MSNHKGSSGAGVGNPSGSRSLDSFGVRAGLRVDDTNYQIFDLNKLPASYEVHRLPYCLKIILENLLRHEDGVNVKREDIEAVASRMRRRASVGGAGADMGVSASADTGPGAGVNGASVGVGVDDQQAGYEQLSHEIAFSPERVLMQDFTGVPAVCDLAAMRDAMVRLGGDPQKINPHVPVELVIDHSVIVDYWTGENPFARNVEMEYHRNIERYRLLRYAQGAFDDFSVVPPGTGICHQVNLEYLARVVFAAGDGEYIEAYPDTLVGTDSHTTMVNGLGVLGWGVGGIEAEAAMLGQPLTMTIPSVVGVRLYGELQPGVTSTDLVLTLTALLRSHGVVGKLVEYFGEGIASLPVETRATIANMAPEYGATCGIFPVDAATLDYLRMTARQDEQVLLVEAYTKHQGLFHGSGYAGPAQGGPDGSDGQGGPGRPGGPSATGGSGNMDHGAAATGYDGVIYDELVELDLSSVEPSIAGPSRPQDRIPLSGAKMAFQDALGHSPKTHVLEGDDGSGDDAVAEVTHLSDGDVVIAAITSCTNTSNPYVLVAAGLLARKAHDFGLLPKPWVKTSLAPGSRVVMDYLERAGLDEALSSIGFNLVGYGCTTCIGNSGPLVPGVSEAIREAGLTTCAVLSGNRNFEGRIHPDVRSNYLASPPLVVAYALAGTMRLDLTTEPIGTSPDGQEVFLEDIWPSDEEVVSTVRSCVTRDSFKSRYASVFTGDEHWQSIDVPVSDTFDWDTGSTYVLEPPFFTKMDTAIPQARPFKKGSILAVLGDSVTTDHISPAGSISPTSPAGRWLEERGVEPKEFNSYGSRRGNHEVMMRGTFANARIRNKMVPEQEGGFTVHIPSNTQTTIYDAAMMYAGTGTGADTGAARNAAAGTGENAAAGTPLVILAGKEYGTGSSRDWAAKGPALLGIRAVVARSFERIHRSNLVGMGILPLQLPDGADMESLGITGSEEVSIPGIEAISSDPVPHILDVHFGDKVVACTVRLDTETEVKYYRNGGILQYVLRQILG